jgi:multidrug resistance efflux pump
LKEAQRAVEECLVVAPASGTVLRILVSPGDIVGSQPRQPAIQFCPDGPRVIRAEIPQEFARRVTVGQAVSAQDDTTEEAATWTGRVARLSDWFTQRRAVVQEPLEKNDVRTLECLITLDPGQPPLRIGQRMRVTIKR